MLFIVPGCRPKAAHCLRGYLECCFGIGLLVLVALAVNVYLHRESGSSLSSSIYSDPRRCHCRPSHPPPPRRSSFPPPPPKMSSSSLSSSSGISSASSHLSPSPLPLTVPTTQSIADAALAFEEGGGRGRGRHEHTRHIRFLLAPLDHIVIENLSFGFIFLHTPSHRFTEGNRGGASIMHTSMSALNPVQDDGDGTSAAVVVVVIAVSLVFFSIGAASKKIIRAVLSQPKKEHLLRRAPCLIHTHPRTA
jgi:hypothetical protein